VANESKVIRQQAHSLVNAHGENAPIQAAIVDPTNCDSVPSVESVNRTPTLADLPSPNIKRWHIQRKAMVVTAVRTGRINVAEVCARYNITIEEFLSWTRLLDEHGMRGLRATCLQKYRHSAKVEGMANAESADIGAVR